MFFIFRGKDVKHVTVEFWNLYMSKHFKFFSHLPIALFSCGQPWHSDNFIRSDLKKPNSIQVKQLVPDSFKYKTTHNTLKINTNFVNNYYGEKVIILLIMNTLLCVSNIFQGRSIDNSPCLLVIIALQPCLAQFVRS